MSSMNPNLNPNPHTRIYGWLNFQLQNHFHPVDFGNKHTPFPNTPFPSDTVKLGQVSLVGRAKIWVGSATNTIFAPLVLLLVVYYWYYC